MMWGSAPVLSMQRHEATLLMTRLVSGSAHLVMWEPLPEAQKGSASLEQALCGSQPAMSLAPQIRQCALRLASPNSAQCIPEAWAKRRMLRKCSAFSFFRRAFSAASL